MICCLTYLKPVRNGLGGYLKSQKNKQVVADCPTVKSIFESEILFDQGSARNVLTEGLELPIGWLRWPERCRFDNISSSGGQMPPTGSSKLSCPPLALPLQRTKLEIDLRTEPAYPTNVKFSSPEC